MWNVEIFPHIHPLTLHQLLLPTTKIAHVVLSHNQLHGAQPCLSANRSSANQEITHVLWYPKFRYTFQKHPPPLPFLSQNNPVHDPSYYFLNIRFNIIFQSTSVSPKLSFSLQISPPMSVHTSSVFHTCYTPHTSHYSGFYYLNYIWSRVQSMKLFDIQFLPFSFTSSLLDANIFLCTIFSNTLGQCFFFNVWHQESHPYASNISHPSSVPRGIYSTLHRIKWETVTFGEIIPCLRVTKTHTG